MNARDLAFKTWWKKRRRSIAPPHMLGLARMACEQGWKAGWNNRDWNGPDEKLARSRPLPGDLWLKHTARGVNVLRRVLLWHEHFIDYEEKIGFANWAKKTVQCRSWQTWTKGAALKQRGTSK